MTWTYLARRLGMFFLTIWAAATINFFIPRLSGQDPIAQRLAERAVSGGSVQTGMQQMIADYNEKFGLGKPLWEQYLAYLNDMAHLNFNYSISAYPTPVSQILADAIPWTLGLLGVSTLLMFALGSLLGALLAWPRTPRLVRFATMPFVAFSAVPYYLLGLILAYVFAFRLQVLPLFGGYSNTVVPEFSVSFLLDVLQHAILPATSVVLAGLGMWALAMRGMMLTVQGEDYIAMAEAKGLKQRTIFFRYGMRNAILPQTTSLVLSLGYILSGSVLVEVTFNYPGIGSALYQAIRSFDYFLIQGIVFTVVVAIALGALIIDLALPFLDPRINYGRS